MLVTMSKRFKLLSWILSVTGLVWQLHMICNQYFQYPFTTEIIFEVPTRVSIPTSFIKISLENNFIQNLPNSTTSQQLFDLFPEPERVHVPLYSNYNRNVSKFIAFHSVVYKFSPIRKFLEPNKRKMPIEMVHMKQSTLMTFAGKVMVSVGPSTFNGEGQSELRLDLSKKLLVFVVDYSRIRKLAHPYTDCFDFQRAFGEYSGENCFFHCFSQQMMQRAEMLPEDTKFDQNSPNVTIFAPMRDRNSQRLSVVRRSLEGLCRTKCKMGARPCDELFYQLNAVDSTHYLHIDYNDVMAIYFCSSDKPDMMSTYKPLITTVDFIVYFLSAISFWLGIAPLSTLLVLGKKFAKAKVGVSRSR